jgi:hypothetical protein
MTPSVIASARLRSQRITQRTQSARTNQSAAPSVQRVVEWMGAMQAQDFVMAKWAVGVRLPGCTEAMVEQALAEGAIIRTHLLRPTWHIASRDDVRWLLDLTGPRIKAALSHRQRDLELTADVVRKSNTIIAKMLRDGNYCGRELIVPRLNEAGIQTDENRTSHILLAAELDGIICSGPVVRGKPTYALLDERVPSTKRMARDEALAALARRYFASRCPATVQDFAWWSGLAAGDAARAAALLGKDFHSEAFGSATYWFPSSYSAPRKNGARVHLLPAYDEYTISYRDRGAALPAAKVKAAVSSNGIFYPLVILDGKAVGTWKRAREANRMLIQPQLFGPKQRRLTALMEKASRLYARFLGVPVEIAP